MEKPAPTQHPIHELLRRRWSPHAFSPRPIETEKLQSLFEAARWAPSSFGEQPWVFIVATKENPADYAKMFECLVEGNRAWASTAPVLVLSVASLSFAHNGKPNRHALHDVGAAMADLTLQAMSEGIFVHQMAGIDVNKARETYNIPATHEPVAGAAIGYPGDIDALPEALRQRTIAARTRKPMDQFVFSGKWGETAPIAKAGR
jgi:nitroreductase